MRIYEQIIVFYKKQSVYNRIMIKRTYEEFKKSYRKNERNVNPNGTHYTHTKKLIQSMERQKYKPPINTLYFKRDDKRDGSQHPTQKPIELMEYLVKTYTNENETVLDFTMGSGSTMVACQNTNRNGIGIEMDDKYFEVATKRINKLKLF